MMGAGGGETCVRSQLFKSIKKPDQEYSLLINQVALTTLGKEHVLNIRLHLYLGHDFLLDFF